MNTRRFGALLVVIAVLAILAVAGVSWLYFHKADTPGNEQQSSPASHSMTNDPYESLPANMADALRHCPGNEAAVVEIMGRWELSYTGLKPCLKLMLKVTIMNDQVTYSQDYPGLRFTPGKSYTKAYNSITQPYRDFTVTGLAAGDRLFGAIERSKWNDPDGIWSGYHPATSLESGYTVIDVHEVYLLVYADNDRTTNHVTQTPWPWDGMVWAMYTHPLSF